MVVQLIGVTTTRAGLTVNAKLDKRQYPINVEVTAEEMVSVNLGPNAFHERIHHQAEPSKHEKVKVVPLIVYRQ